MTKQDRYRGALVGLGACDALGTSVEFCPPGSFTPLAPAPLFFAAKPLEAVERSGDSSRTPPMAPACAWTPDGTLAGSSSGL